MAGKVRVLQDSLIQSKDFQHQVSTQLPSNQSAPLIDASTSWDRDKESRESTPADHFDGAATRTRVERIETTLLQLSASVDRVLKGLSTAQPVSHQSLGDHGLSAAGRTEAGEENSNTQLVIGPSHAFSFLTDVSSNLEAIKTLLAPSAEHDDARRGLESLSSALTTSEMNENEPRPSNRYWIPDRQEAYALISREENWQPLNHLT